MGDLQRPVILLSSSGSRLLLKASRYCEAVYVACLRNAASLAVYLAANYERVAIIGAGSRLEFREEDQLCCAWIARDLLESGFEPLNSRTREVIRNWKDAGLQDILGGKSVNYLRSSGQWRDLEYILSHVNDLQDIYTLRYGEVVTARELVFNPVVGSISDAGNARDTASKC
jgi:2-phosphosulfolactate phosphatase